MKRELDILCVGEVLIDFIGHQKEVRIDKTRDYHRYLGGSPTNVAMNLARLGMKVKLAATIGDDGLGVYIKDKLTENGVQTDLITTDPHNPTSVIFVSKLRAHQILYLIGMQTLKSQKPKCLMLC